MLSARSGEVHKLFIFMYDTQRRVHRAQHVYKIHYLSSTWSHLFLWRLLLHAVDDQRRVCDDDDDDEDSGGYIKFYGSRPDRRRRRRALRAIRCGLRVRHECACVGCGRKQG